MNFISRMGIPDILSFFNTKLRYTRYIVKAILDLASVFTVSQRSKNLYAFGSYHCMTVFHY